MFDAFAGKTKGSKRICQGNIVSHNLMGYPYNPKMIISAIFLHLLLLSHQTGEGNLFWFHFYNRCYAEVFLCIYIDTTIVIYYSVYVVLQGIP